MTTPFFYATYWPILFVALTESKRLSQSVIGIALILIVNLVELPFLSSMMGLKTLTQELKLLGSFNVPFLAVLGTHLAIVRLCGYRLVTRLETKSDANMQDFNSES